MADYDRIAVALTTDGAGVASVDTPQEVNGIINSIVYEPGTLANNVVVTVTEKETGNVIFQETIIDASIVNTWYLSPQTHDPATGLANTNGLGVSQVSRSQLTVGVSAGGVTKAGTLHFHVR